RFSRDWSSDVCSSDLGAEVALFSTLYAAYFALKDGVMEGPLPIDVFDFNYTIIMTIVLLTSSFTSGLAIHEMRRNNIKAMVVWQIGRASCRERGERR